MIIYIKRYKERFIIIHHSADPDDYGLDFDDYLDFHVRIKRWRDIGYNAVNEEVEGEVINIFGRPPTMPGAHCPANYMNFRSLGFCFAGNFSKKSGPSDARILSATQRVIIPWMIDYDIPIEHIRPHRYYMKTECPGKFFRWDKLIAEINGALNGV